MSNRATRVAGVLLATSSMVGVAACSGDATTAAGSDSPTSATVYLGFSADAVYAPAYVAQELGYYEDEGIDITIAPGQGSTDAIRVVTAGQADFGYSDALTMTKAVADGGDLRMLATVMPVAPAASLVKSDSPIESIEDLRGARLGDSQDSTQFALLPGLLAQGGLTLDDVEFVNLNFASRVPALLSDKIDVTQGYATEFPNVADQTRLILWRDFGLNYYAEGLYSTNDYLADPENAETARKFVAATMRGLDYTIENPDEAAEIVARAAQADDPSFYLGEMEQLLPILEAHDDEGLGHMNDERWQETVDLVEAYLDPQGSVDVADLYTNEYLP